jgi:copper chaperone CopZ
MPVPPPNVPTPQTPTPAPVAKTPAPSQPASFSGTVKIIAYSEVISTGEGNAKPSASAVDFEKVETALKRVSGVSSASYNPSTRSIDVGYNGSWTDLNKLTMAVNNNGISAEMASPARVVLRPMVVIEDENKVLTAVKAVSGVQYVSRENGDIVSYCDLTSVSLDSIKSACESTGVKGMIVSHEELKVGFGSGGAGNTSALQDDLAKTKWVIKSEIDSGSNCVKVIAPKGRVTKALVKSLLSKHGFAEAK